MFRASATGTPKLEGMYVRVGSSSAQDAAEAEDDETSGGYGGAGPAVRGLAELGERLQAARALESSQALSALLKTTLSPIQTLQGIFRCPGLTHWSGSERLRGVAL